MPIFDIESEDGRKISLEGDTAPSPDEIEEIFAGIPKKQDAMSMPSMELKPQFGPMGVERLPIPPGTPKTFQSAPNVQERPAAIFDPEAIARQEQESEAMRHASPIPSFPEGKTITEKTGIPRAAAVPISAVGKLISGVGQFFTSPAGASEAAVAATPAAPVMLVKWGYDMLKSAKESLGDLTKIPGDVVHQYVADLMRRNVQGSPLPDEYKQDFYQRGADDLVNVLALGFGGAKAGKSGIKGVLEAPKEMRARAESLGLEGEMRDVLRNTENQPLSDVDTAANIRLGLPPKATPEMLPELQRTKALVDQAIQEATQKIETPGPKAIDLLKARDAEIAPATKAIVERPGGGEAVGGKVSFMRPAEAPLPERTQQAIEREVSNAIVQPEVERLRQQERPGADELGKTEGPSGSNRPVESGEKPKAPEVATPEKPKEVWGGGEIMSESEWTDVFGKKFPHRANGIRSGKGGRGIDIERSNAARARHDKPIAEENRKNYLEYVRRELEAGKPIRNEWLRAFAMIEREASAKYLEKYGYDTSKKPWTGPDDPSAILTPVKSPPSGSGISGISFFDRQSEMEGLGRMSTAPTLEDIRAQRAAEAKQSKPEVAKLDTNVDKNKFGDPRGTTYHATPEDWAAWQEVQNQPVMESFAERERIKNKYGGMPPEPPKESSAQPRQGTSSQPSSLLEGDQTKAAETPAAVSDAIQSGIQAIESLQKKIRGARKNLNLGVPSAILDTALEAARLSLKAGKSVAEAIEAALAHIRRNIRKGDWNEAKVKAMLEKELSGAVAKPVVPAEAAKPTATKTEDVAAPNRTVEETLSKVQKVFEPKPKQKTPVSVKASNVVEAVRTGLSSKFRPVNWLEEMVAKANPSYKPKDIAGIMEQLKGSQGKGEADVYRFDRDVSKLVSGSEKDFSEYVFMRRTLDRLKQDAADINRAIAGEEVPVLNRRSVSDFTINELEPALKAFEQKLGPEKLKKFQEAADQYQRHMDNALRLQVESGRMSPEIYDAIKSGNEFYAPFKVMKYLEESSRPEGSGRKIDTVADYTKAMKGIEDRDFRLGDMLAAGRQNILMSRILADKNTAMRAVAEIAPYDIEGRFIKKLKPSEEVPSGMAAVNVLEGGKKQRYAVDTKVAEAIQLYGGNAGGFLVKAAAFMGVPFRAGATALNIPFQVSNLLADQPRVALVSKVGLGEGGGGIRGLKRNPAKFLWDTSSDMVRYPMDFLNAVFSSIGKDVFGINSKLMFDFMDSGVAGTTVQEYLTPEALKFKEPTTISRSRKLASTVLNTIPDFAKAIEQTSKVMGVQRAMRFSKVIDAQTGKLRSVQSGKELAKLYPEMITELRRFSGSPDFGRQGKWVEGARLNLIYMFLNARIQGTIADVGRLAGRDGSATAAKTWLRLAAAVGIPSVYVYYLNTQKGNKEDYESRPIQERQNYWLIPKEDENGKPRYITTEEGEKIRDYWRIPKRESSKWIANLTESALNFAQNRNPKAATDFGNQMLQELSPVNIQGDTAQEKLESVASSLNPMIKFPLELGTGRDLYRHRPIMSDQLKKASPEEQYTERTPEAFKKLAVAMPDVLPEVIRSPIMLENLTRNLTAGLVTQFLPRKDVQGRSKLENNPLLQRFQSLPMTDNSEFQENVKGLERQAVDEQLNRHRKALEAMEKNPNAQLPNLIASVLPKDKSKITSDDVKLMEHLTDLWVAKQNGATFKDRQVMALPARQRALWVQQQLGGLTPQKKAEKILELARKRIFTESVAAELVNLEQEKEK